MKRILIFLFLLGSLQVARACESCGCGSMFTGADWLSTEMRSYLKWSYDASWYRNTSLEDEDIHDNFNKGSLGFNQALGRWSIETIIGYSWNNRYAGDSLNSIHGLNDLGLILHRKLISDRLVTGRIIFNFRAATGIQAPFGYYNSSIHDRDLPEHFNPGRGAWSGLITISAVLGGPKWGLGMNAKGIAYMKSTNGYRYGPGMNYVLMGYRTFSSESTYLTLSIGAAADKVFQDIYRSGNIHEETGGNGIYLNTGIKLEYKQAMLNISGALPLKTEYSNSEVVADGKLGINLYFLLDNKRTIK